MSFDENDIPDVQVSRQLSHAHPVLVERFQRLQAEFETICPGRTLLITCTYRSVEEQQRLYKRGRGNDKGPKVTNVDGVRKRSNHNKYPSRAIDVAVLVGGKVTWDEAAYYPIGPLSTKHRLGWGGYWTKFQDYPHLELPDEVA